MKTPLLTGLAISLAAFLPVGPVLADPPALRWATVPNDFDKDTCLRRARRALERAGYRRIDVDSSDVEGVNGDFSTEVVCTRNLIFVVVAGPSNRMAGRLRDAVADQM